MSAYGTKSKTTKILAEFRHARFFQDEDVATLTNREFYGDDLPEGVDPNQLLYHDLKVDDDGKVVSLRQYEGTPRDAFLAFKRTKIGSDDQGIRDLLYHEDLINRREYRQAIADGMSPEDADDMYLKEAERTDLPYAKAEYYTRKVVGAYFRMPKKMQNKDVYGDDPKKLPEGLKPDDLYEHAGQIPPTSYLLFEVLDVSVLIEYLNYMDEVHGGRSPVQEATFPAGTVPADDEPAVPLRRGSKRQKPA